MKINLIYRWLSAILQMSEISTNTVIKASTGAEGEIRM